MDGVQYSNLKDKLNFESTKQTYLLLFPLPPPPPFPVFLTYKFEELHKLNDFPDTKTQKNKMRSETITLVLVNLAGIMERADESLLPGVYKEVGAALHTDPTGLGSLTLFRSIVQASCYPLAAYLAIRHNRAHVIALGAFLWSAATFLVAFSSTFFQVSVFPLFLFFFVLSFSQMRSFTHVHMFTIHQRTSASL